MKGWLEEREQDPSLQSRTLCFPRNNALAQAPLTALECNP